MVLGYFLYQDTGFLFNPVFGLYEPYVSLVVWALLEIFGETYAPMIIYNIFLYTLLLIGIYFFTKNVFESKTWGIVSLLFIVTNNMFFKFVFFVSREISTIVFITLLVVFIFYYFKKNKIIYLVIFSILVSHFPTGNLRMACILSREAELLSFSY